ncbi:MAG: DUF3256 family protein [Bacteroidales bacterium]
MKKLTMCLLLLMSVMSVSAQNIKPFFTISTESSLAYLSVNQRKDLIDLFEAGKQAAVPNSLRGKTELLDLSEQHLKLKLSSLTMVDMLLLNRADSIPVILFLKSELGNLKESNIKFYTTDWVKEKPESYIDLPTRYEFMKNPQDSTVREEIDAITDLFFLDIRVDTSTMILSVLPSFNDPIDKAASERLKSLLINYPLRYRWGGSRFVREE